MKRRIQSLRVKIWINMVITVFILATVVIGAGLLINLKFKTEAIFNELEGAMELKFSDDQSGEGKHLHTSWTPHFRVQWYEDGPVLSLDAVIREKFLSSEDGDVIFRIVEELEGYSEEIKKGKVLIDNTDIYYLVVPTGDNGSMVFFDTQPGSRVISPAYLLIILLLLIIGFFTSGILASKVTKPIYALGEFADEISKRNWLAKVPASDTKELTNLADALEKMKQALKALDERDRKFLQSASHDLKTPVMIIKGYAQAMKDGVGIQSEQSTASVLLEESAKLERRITQLLRLNTIDHSMEHDMEKEALRIDRLLRSLVKRFEVVEPGLTWELETEEVEVTGNGESLLVAFENLIENQVRYAKSKIWISCHKTDKVNIIIGNDGPGFETENIVSLFDPYRKESDGNFGLGLSIVKKVIEGHDGQVSGSNVDGGVEFLIRI